MKNCILLFLIFFTSLAEGAPPLALFLTWQHDPTQTMTLVWLTADPEPQPLVEYQKEEPCSSIWMQKNAESQAFPHHYHCQIHRVELTNLTPDTLYRFRLGENGTEHLFRTLANNLNRPLRFVEGGDCYHDTLPMLEKTNQMAAAIAPDFVILGGDLAYAANGSSNKSDDCKRWLAFLQAWTRTMVTKQGRLIPLLVAIGNHEVNGHDNQTPEQAQVFYSLFPTPGGKSNYLLNIGDYLTVAALDTGHSQPIYPQAEWLDQAMTYSPSNAYRFVYYHVPAYPSVRSFHSSTSSAIRKYWHPIIDRHSVDVVFEHHDHAYKRTHPIANGVFDANGTLFLGDGAWGAKPRKPRRNTDAWYLAKTAAKNQFIVVTLTPERALFQAVTPEGEVIDSFERIRKQRL